MIIVSAFIQAFSNTKDFVMHKTGILFSKASVKTAVFLDIAGKFFDEIHYSVDDIDCHSVSAERASSRGESVCKKIAKVFTSYFKRSDSSRSTSSEKKNKK